MNCLTYARVSTDKQADKELSIPAQLQAMRQYAQQRNWQIREEFVEPGASARTADRPVLRQLLSKCRDQHDPVDVVLVHKIDRLARNVADHATIRALLQQRKIRLVSVTENLDDTTSGALVENIMAAIAEFYSANLADEVRKGMRQKVLRGGWPHKPPRGYISTPTINGSKIEPHPIEGPLVAEAFELFTSGWYSMKGLAHRLERAGLKNAGGGPISQSYLHRLLTNPFYVGRVRWGDVDVPGQHLPLVSRDLFERAQQLIRSRFRALGGRARLEGFPLRGFAICANCRGRLTAERHARWDYYRCCRRSYRKSNCTARFVNANRAHADLRHILQQISLSTVADSVNTAIDRRQQEQEATQHKRIEQLRREDAELMRTEMRLTDAFVAGDVSPDVYRLKSAEVRKQRDDLKRLASCESTTRQPRRRIETATSLWEVYGRLEASRQALFIQTVFKTIVLAPEGIVGSVLNPPFDGAEPNTELESKTIDQLGQLLAA